MGFGGRLFTILWLICAARGLQWSGNLSTDSGRTIQICSGQNLQLFWNFTLDKGEQLKSMEWRCQPEGEQEELLASYMDDNFVPAAPFSGRLTYLQGGSIEVGCATILESGNYSIAVSVETSTKSLTVHYKTTTVKVVDAPKTHSGKLHVTRKAEAVRDVISGEWHMTLTCGNFSDQGHPPVDVMWTTPKGEQLQSNSYKNGAFLLMLANPVRGGNYSCRIPPSQTAMTCLPGDSPLRHKEVVEVEEMTGRLTVMEARQQQMIGQLAAERNHWEDVQIDTANRTSVLEQRLDKALQNFESAGVSFHVKLTSNKMLSSGSILILTSVVSNQGGGYNPQTGYFTAPVNGTYFFIGTTGLNSRNYVANLRLMREGSAICDTYVQSYSSYYSMGSCPGVVYLSVGERVWLQSSGSNSYFFALVTSFSGFRIN